MLTIEDYGDFSWSYGKTFFVETAKGNYIWSDPDYGGDNTITPFRGNYKDWCEKEHIPFARAKGKHVIGTYCGKDVKIQS